MSTEIAKCQGCGGGHVLRQSRERTLGVHQHRRYCSFCGWAGSWQFTRKLADAAWNKVMAKEDEDG